MAEVTGPFGPGACADQALQGVMNLLDSSTHLYNVNSFINPQAQNIINMATGHESVANGLLAYATGPPALPPEQLALVTELTTQLANFDHAQQSFEIWSDYISGKTDTFPLPALQAHFDYFGEGVVIPNSQWALLASFGFIGLMGVATGITRVDYALCTVDPEDPCAKIKNIFAAILNAGTALLNTIIAGFQIMTDFAGKIVEYIAQVTAYVDDLINMVLAGIDLVVKTILEGLRFGLAKLFSALKFDPCMAQIMEQVCGPALKTAIGI